MKRKPSDPLANEIWILVQESEGLIAEAFTQQKAAKARAKQLSRKFPTLRIEVAKYLIAMNSRKSFGSTIEEEEEVDEE